MNDAPLVNEKAGEFRRWFSEFCYWYGWLMGKDAPDDDKLLYEQEPKPKRLKFYWSTSYGCVDLRIDCQDRMPDLTRIVRHGQTINELRMFTRSEWEGRAAWCDDNHFEQVLQAAFEIETQIKQSLPGINQLNAIRVCALQAGQASKKLWNRPTICENLVGGQWRCGICPACKSRETLPD
jgi:hypothetical protein